jgi:hypothetical protein
VPWALDTPLDVEVAGPTVPAQVTSLRLGYQLVAQPESAPHIEVHLFEYINGTRHRECDYSPIRVPEADAVALAQSLVDGELAPEFEAVLWDYLNFNELIPEGSEA